MAAPKVLFRYLIENAFFARRDAGRMSPPVGDIDFSQHFAGLAECDQRFIAVPQICFCSFQVHLDGSLNEQEQPAPGLALMDDGSADRQITQLYKWKNEVEL